MKKPFLSFYEQNLNNNILIDGRTMTDSVEDTDSDNFTIILNGSTSTRMIEDTDYDNSIFDTILDD